MKVATLVSWAMVLSIAPPAHAGVPYPTRRTPSPQDLGPLREVAGSESVSATLALTLRNSGELESLLAALYTPGSAQFRKFLTPAEFRARFAPSPESLRPLIARLEASGLRVELVNGTLLRLTGPAAAMERAFGVELRSFQVPDGPGAAGYRFHAPAAAPRLDPDLAQAVDAVVGLDSRPRFRPLHHAAQLTVRTHPLPRTGAPATPNPPGEWTVADLAQYYDVEPLYQAGYDGRGRTIGIVTLASFTPSDAFAYWASLGLTVDPRRLRIVDVDGGPGAPSDDSGSEETALDVEQSGGLAPAARVIVYQAPNTDQGFLDAFARAVADNRAEAVSVSWGEWEILLAGAEVADPSTGRPADETLAFHNVFVQAALQGQSLFAASGDAGSYDANEIFLLPQFSQVLSVDHPAADPFVTAAGGTTLPGTQEFLLSSGDIYTVDIPEERAWSWDYLDGLCALLGFDPVSCGIFPVGSGGGVSVVWTVPRYQQGLSGVRRSEPRQTLVDFSHRHPVRLLTLPARFPGRNVPDVSLNADPDTGYVIFYTSDQNGFIVDSFIGGTSFVAPQLAGITALLDQSVGGRIGLMNLALYGSGYGPGSPLRDIQDGNNEFYSAVPGYDPATGLGVLDAANFAAMLR